MRVWLGMRRRWQRLLLLWLLLLGLVKEERNKSSASPQTKEVPAMRAHVHPAAVGPCASNRMMLLPRAVRAQLRLPRPRQRV